MAVSIGFFLTLQQINVAEAAPKVIHWKFVCDYPAGDLQTDTAVPKLARWIEEASEGRMREKAISEIWPKIAEKDETSAKYIEAIKHYLKDEGEIK